MYLDARRKETLEDVDAALGMWADERAPDIGRNGMNRDVHGLEPACDDPLDVLVRHVGEGDEIPLEE